MPSKKSPSKGEWRAEIQQHSSYGARALMPMLTLDLYMSFYTDVSENYIRVFSHRHGITVKIEYMLGNVFPRDETFQLKKDQAGLNLAKLTPAIIKKVTIIEKKWIFKRALIYENTDFNTEQRETNGQDEHRTAEADTGERPTEGKDHHTDGDRTGEDTGHSG